MSLDQFDRLISEGECVELDVRLAPRYSPIYDAVVRDQGWDPLDG